MDKTQHICKCSKIAARGEMRPDAEPRVFGRAGKTLLLLNAIEWHVPQRVPVSKPQRVAPPRLSGIHATRPPVFFASPAPPARKDTAPRSVFPAKDQRNGGRRRGLKAPSFSPTDRNPPDSDPRAPNGAPFLKDRRLVIAEGIVNPLWPTRVGIHARPPDGGLVSPRGPGGTGRRPHGRGRPDHGRRRRTARHHARQSGADEKSRIVSDPHAPRHALSGRRRRGDQSRHR